jgi:hypothetical protein
VVDPCENSNECLGSLKGGQFLGYLSDCKILMKDSASWS